MKDSHSDAGPSSTTSAPKEGLSPRKDSDLSPGEINSASWVVDSSGFLSPAGPVLKEVLDLVDGVSIRSRCGSNRWSGSHSKLSFLVPGHWWLVQSSSFWPTWRQPEPRTPPVPSGGKHFTGAEQRQQRGTDPHLAWRSHFSFHSPPPQPKTHRLVSRCLQLHDPKEHSC